MDTPLSIEQNKKRNFDEHEKHNNSFITTPNLLLCDVPEAQQTSHAYMWFHLNWCEQNVAKYRTLWAEVYQQPARLCKLEDMAKDWKICNLTDKLFAKEMTNEEAETKIDVGSIF